ncbi:MAG: hypothetical protein IPN32_36530 [Deltaproteobacteria bacterium]|nr:hypothetical protein [Deltaproteobacteria bacterium]
MTEFGSSTDLETLRRSGRGKFIVLGVLIAGALGAAGYSFLKKGGTGNPEEAGKVLVVTRGTHVGYSVVLERVGFEAAEGSFEAWVNKAKDEVPDLKVDGTEAIMALADRFGWGFVVFEQPGEVDFSKLDLEGGVPSFPEHVRWAAVSAGDFAFPHHLTVNPEPSKVLKDGTVSLLQALFEQEQLAALREPDALPVAQLQLRDKLREALRKLDDVPEAERMANKVVDDIREMLTEGERGAMPSLIGEPLESVVAHPLPDNTLLSTSRAFEIVTRDAVRADLDLAPEESLLAGAVGAEPGQRTPCSALLGGTAHVGDWRGFWWSPDGAALLSGSHEHGDTLWRFDATTPGCSWTALGAVAPARAGIEGDPHVNGKGMVARTGSLGGLGVISVVAPGEPEQLLGMLESTSLSDLRWIDDDRLVAIGTYELDGSRWLMFFSRSESLKVLVVSTSVVEGAMSLRDVVAVPGEPALLAVLGGAEDRLFRVSMSRPLAGMFAEPPLAPEKTPIVADARPTVYELDPTLFSATLLASTAQITDVVVSPDGHHAAFVVRGGDTDPDHDDDAEIAVVDTNRASMRVLTRNELRDSSPLFTADGKHVVFETRVELPRSKWVVAAARMVAAEP